MTAVNSAGKLETAILKTKTCDHPGQEPNAWAAEPLFIVDTVLYSCHISP
jgi:hypothetical protein